MTSDGDPRRPGRGRRVLLRALLAVLLVLVAGAGVLYQRTGLYGFTVLARRGMTTWSATGPQDPRLSPGVRLALQPVVPPAVPGPLGWRQAAPGFEVAELPVLAGGAEVDRILLSRVDPARYRFQVRSRPAGDREIGDWMAATGAVLAVNGSYFADDGRPATPVVSDRKRLGPGEYTATHGAFVAGRTGAGLVDLTGRSWQQELAGAEQAMVSYPMLLGADGGSRATGADPVQLANRSFLGQDSRGRVLVGTTVDGFFSLARLAEFLRAAPLDLRLALNLDGGPVACQAVRLGQVRRDFCGRWETARHDGQVELLGSLVGSRRAGLPLVLTVSPVP